MPFLITIGTIKLKHNINLHTYNIVKAVLFELVTSIKVKGNAHGSHSKPIFDSAVHIFSTTMKDIVSSNVGAPSPPLF